MACWPTATSVYGACVVTVCRRKYASRVFSENFWTDLEAAMPDKSEREDVPVVTRGERSYPILAPYLTALADKVPEEKVQKTAQELLIERVNKKRKKFERLTLRVWKIRDRLRGYFASGTLPLFCKLLDFLLSHPTWFPSFQGEYRQFRYATFRGEVVIFGIHRKLNVLSIEWCGSPGATFVSSSPSAGTSSPGNT
eukprot:NODE_1956_length_860_cov_134.054254_g1372_i0.p1 GENE.NODE_1956_length_860_cov_134.054254_g1372_i0~~NODE_1956_length_860_cov_134.054254_g1372_i0.p1  ORF type:complete len:196 (+),score=44.76 NODE_1956_length_860_cov_134.054254_g1372_i0:130-717(+)